MVKSFFPVQVPHGTELSMAGYSLWLALGASAATKGWRVGITSKSFLFLAWQEVSLLVHVPVSLCGHVSSARLVVAPSNTSIEAFTVSRRVPQSRTPEPRVRRCQGQTSSRQRGLLLQSSNEGCGLLAGILHWTFLVFEICAASTDGVASFAGMYIAREDRAHHTSMLFSSFPLTVRSHGRSRSLFLSKGPSQVLYPVS